MGEYTPGNEADFNRLYEEYYPKLVRQLTTRLRDGATAEDCAQSAFLKAYTHWPDWKPDAPPEAWVWRIATNVMISYLRHERMREQKDVLTIDKTVVDPADVAGLKMIQAQVRGAVSLLPPKIATTLVLYYWGGLTRDEVARRLGIPQGTVSSRIDEGRKLVKQLLVITGSEELLQA